MFSFYRQELSDSDWEPETEVLTEVHVEPSVEPDDGEDGPSSSTSRLETRGRRGTEVEVPVELSEESEDGEGPSSSKTPRLETRGRRGRGRGSGRGRDRGRGRGSGRGRVRGSGRGRGRGRRQRTADTQPLIPPPEGMWNDIDTPDIRPTPLPFCPANPPGSQLLTTSKYTILQFFQQFFTNAVLLTVINNSNKHGRSQNTEWTDVTLADMYSFIAILIYMALVKAPTYRKYWNRSKQYNFPYPKTIITGKKFLSILSTLHLSDPEDDRTNNEKRWTPLHDRLQKIKPLYTDLRIACRQNFQPGQHIAIDERMVASKARITFKQYLKSKPVKWGFKLFVLADSLSGYTWDFFVYEGKSADPSQKGLSYDIVMSLLNTSLLGTGYKLYVDNFYTSPILFKDLLQKKVSACGTIRTIRKGYPRTTVNVLKPKDTRGTIKWIREGPLLFVQWRDTRDVFMCSTMHEAHGDETVSRRVKDDAGHWVVKEVPVPPAIKDYNKHMGGVDLSDALIGYYELLHKTKKWYKTFFFHFLDIGIVNAFILYKEHCKVANDTPMTQLEFRETLMSELDDEAKRLRNTQDEGNRAPVKKGHRLVHITSEGGKTYGRLKCRKCKVNKTPVKCATCDIPLCFQQKRDCYNEWHEEKGL
ncbi:hypothetical protein WMY93_029028 [Mugilogobius chulae]|uniref:PiggyBac transposable element-derived protein domain-containing protein n=1 Tax=Mugilogobius chulae TaxID=88201 RepID=A0AAW0MU70_9GOBI